ncbi:MAG: alkane 1-monooxygenase [Candidatus Sericytochromatia bacterium]
MMLAAETARPLPFWAFGVAYIVPLLLLPALWLGGAVWYAVPTFVFVLVPVLDHLLGLYRYNPSPAETEALLQSAAFRWMTWSWVPVQAVLVLGGAWLMAQGGLAPFEQVGLVLSVGIATGAIGITLAHELLHKTSAWERRLSQLLLLLVSYMHFYIEHLRGHHRRVATPDDPASSRLGESFYRFYGRTLVGSWRDAWAIEAQRLGKKQLPLWSHHNQMLWFTGLPLLLAAGLGLLWGPTASLFFVAQSVVAFSLLEAVNYVEHYGLSRRELRPGVYEAVNETHSWNANHLLTNCFLFMLQRHSDHHAHQARRYPILRQFATSPQLPAGYATMILVALLPPLWRRIMDPRVAQWQQAVAQQEATP